MNRTILIVDDDPVQVRLVAGLVERLGHRALTAHGGDAALALLDSAEGRRVDAMILDLVMPDLDGMGVLAALRPRARTLPVIVTTAPGAVEAVGSAMRAGAVDFVVKPVGAERLGVSLANALRLGTLESEVRHLRRLSAGQLALDDIPTRSAGMARAVDLARRAVRTAAPILIEGERGVGKTLFARAIRAAGERRNRPLSVIDCAAQPSCDFEALLSGSATGQRTVPGRLAEAAGGTLLIDEIGLLAPSAQATLLGLIEDSQARGAGRARSRSDMRILATTSGNLIEQVRTGLFREDLFYRLNVLPISIPPLRARRDDIPELARGFLARAAAELGKDLRVLTPGAMELLASHHWPGNVAELENALFRAAVLAQGRELTPSDLPHVARGRSAGPIILPAPAGTPSASTPFGDPATGPSRVPALQPSREAALALTDARGELLPLADLEARAIRFAMRYYEGRMSEVSRRLGIGRSTLYRKLRDLGLSGETGAEAGPVRGL